MNGQTLSHQLHTTATQIVAALQQQDQQLVLAESCTGGLAAATLVQVPGVSNWLCGSLVTYQEQSKTEWLGVEPTLLTTHTAVSAEVTEAMAVAALTKTPGAGVSLAVTGHLERQAADSGPVCFVSIGRRQPDSRIAACPATRFELAAPTRTLRQQESTLKALSTLLKELGPGPIQNP